MTPEQALQIVASATANMNGTREQHATIINALKVLEDLVKREKPHDQ